MKITEKELQEIAYELYKIDWIRDNITPELQLQVEREFWLESLEYEQEFNDVLLWSNWIWDNGYHGSLYACFNEFLDYEYEDEEYMKYLLDEDSEVWKTYKEYEGVE